MIPSQAFVYTRTYSRWIDELGRREFYPESVERLITFFADEIGDVIAPVHKNAARKAIIGMESMPSMRALWAAGNAANNNHITMYNCSYVAVTDPLVFSEILYILMCGTGVGFSVERKYVDQLPPVASHSNHTVNIVVADSKEGWASALTEVLTALWAGHSVKVDFSQVRPRGARLFTMGGRASGPEPLKALFEFAESMFEKRRGQRLQPIDCHDLICKIAEIVVVGGVRRSSEISLSDLDDQHIARAKMGEFYVVHPHRSMSNNSAVYDTKPEVTTFMREFLNLVESGSGERGIFSRMGALQQMAASGRRQPHPDVGTNPCGEILLRPFEFCNLSEVVVRPDDTLETLRQKVKVATMLGVWQSAFTKFPYIRPEWAANCNEERLLGVSITGWMGHTVLNNVNDKMKRWLGDLRGVYLREAEKWARKLGINFSAAIGCVKPSGTVSQLVNCASGIHSWHNDYYVRRYRISATDPLFRMMRDQGVPAYPEVGQEPNTASTWVLEFPMAAPKGAKTRHDINAIEQLEHWKVVKEFWCEHNPSITVYVDDQEWLDVAAWCYKHFEDLCGISFLPKQNHVYQLAPYEDISKEQYEKLMREFPKVDYTQLSKYEMDDNTEGAKSYACTAGACEIP